MWTWKTSLLKQPIYCALFACVIPEHWPGICMDSFLTPFQVNAAPIFLIRFSPPLTGPASIINLDNLDTQIRSYLSYEVTFFYSQKRQRCRKIQQSYDRSNIPPRWQTVLHWERKMKPCKHIRGWFSGFSRTKSVVLTGNNTVHCAISRFLLFSISADNSTQH